VLGLWKTQIFQERETVLGVGNAVDIPWENQPVFHTLPAANISHIFSLWIPHPGVDGFCGAQKEHLILNYTIVGTMFRGREEVF
jgi:hypothetical protein